MQTEYAEKYITLGLKIAYYRKKRGYTQEVFAEKDRKEPQFSCAGRRYGNSARRKP